jgi:hypothetical protein
MEVPAEDTPRRCAAQLTSAPPLWPGWMAASVCTAETNHAETNSTVRPFSLGT